MEFAKAQEMPGPQIQTSWRADIPDVGKEQKWRARRKKFKLFFPIIIIRNVRWLAGKMDKLEALRRQRFNRTHIWSGVKLVPSFSESSCSSRFLTVSTTAEIGMQVKSEVTSKDKVVSLGDSFRCWIFFTNSVEFCLWCRVFPTRSAKLEARCLAVLKVIQLMLLIMGLSGTLSLCILGSP